MPVELTGMETRCELRKMSARLSRRAAENPTF
jgi:hypothetical protein